MAQLIIILCLLTSALSAERQAPERVQYTPKQIAACKKINHIIVIMQENWSFDGLYGMFPGVNGIANASEESMRQLDAKGSLSPNLPVCINTKEKRPYKEIPAKLPNAPFDLQPYIPMTKNTGDLIHHFYQEQQQINGGKMNAFASISNSGGFVMSYYDITETHIGEICKKYTICDNFFHSCYGSSMCGALWLFSGQMPTWANAPQDIIAKVAQDGALLKDGLVTTDGYVINDVQPFYPPFKPGTVESKRMPPLTYKTIGDLLSAEHISWGWYAEGWDKALKGNADPLFPYHHQAPTYFAQYAPGTKERTDHLFDLAQFYKQLDEGSLPAVCFIRSLNSHSGHPGDGPLLPALNWCSDLITKIQNSTVWKDCAIILTYDENGGRWDHVAPPVVDQFGPATRIPTAIISPFAKRGFVDHTSYETVSILKFIEQRFGLRPLSTRDAQANNLLNAFNFK